MERREFYPRVIFFGGVDNVPNILLRIRISYETGHWLNLGVHFFGKIQEGAGLFIWRYVILCVSLV